jgi:hypothetical protein
MLKSVVARDQSKISRIYFRADAGFANAEVYEYLEVEGIEYASFAWIEGCWNIGVL